MTTKEMITSRDLELNLWGSTVTLPKGTRVIKVDAGESLTGDFYAVASVKLLIELTGNAHDPVFRYAGVPTDAVEAK